MTIKDHADINPGENRRFYVHELVEFDVATVSTRPSGVTRLKPIRPADGAGRVQPLKVSVRQLIDAINTKEPSAVPEVSKVVDEDGEPMVVFHGTNADFSKFDLDKSPEGF